MSWLLLWYQILIRFHVIRNYYFLTGKSFILFSILILTHKVAKSSLLLLFSEFVLEFYLFIDLLFPDGSVLWLFEIHVIQTTSVFSLRGLLRFKCLCLLNVVVKNVQSVTDVVVVEVSPSLWALILRGRIVVMEDPFVIIEIDVIEIILCLLHV